MTQEGAPGRFRATVLRGNQVARELPGDDLLANPDIIATRAVAIDAPPAAVWPWGKALLPMRARLQAFDFPPQKVGAGFGGVVVAGNVAVSTREKANLARCA